MERLHIEFQPRIKKQLLAFLKTFSENELKIVKKDSAFEETKKRVQESYRKSLKDEVEKN